MCTPGASAASCPGEGATSTSEWFGREHLVAQEVDVGGASRSGRLTRTTAAGVRAEPGREIAGRPEDLQVHPVRAEHLGQRLGAVRADAARVERVAACRGPFATTAIRTVEERQHRRRW